MWFDCGNVFLNLEKVEHICFEELEGKCKATIYFESGDSLSFGHDNLQVLKNHFRKIFGDKNDG